jgi:hypothetical protein
MYVDSVMFEFMGVLDSNHIRFILCFTTKEEVEMAMECLLWQEVSSFGCYTANVLTVIDTHPIQRLFY